MCLKYWSHNRLHIMPAQVYVEFLRHAYMKKKKKVIE